MENQQDPCNKISFAFEKSEVFLFLTFVSFHKFSFQFFITYFARQQLFLTFFFKNFAQEGDAQPARIDLLVHALLLTAVLSLFSSSPGSFSSVVELRSPNFKGLGFDSSIGTRIFSLSHACDKTNNK